MDSFVALAAGSHAHTVGIAGWLLTVGGLVGIVLWLRLLTRGSHAN